MTAQYVFNRAKPPLLKDYREILAIDRNLLTQLIGSAEWSDQVRVPLSSYPLVQATSLEDIPIHFPPPGPKSKVDRVSDVSYKMVRSLSWTITDGPAHFAEDSELTVEQETGYDLEQKNTFERSLDVEASAGFKLFNLQLSR